MGGSHPDTMCMARASHSAHGRSGEMGTLAYLKVYREEYAKGIEVIKLQNGPEYLKSLDDAIEAWEKTGEKPDVMIWAPGFL